MTKTLICPKCRGTRILYIDRVADATYATNRWRPMQIAFGRPDWRVSGPDLSAKATGEVSAVACGTCGYTELYVKNPEAIVADGEYVKELRGPAHQGPYR